MKLVTLDEMREIEKQAVTSGISENELMKNAGKGIANRLIEIFGEIKKSVIGLIGQGKNGGDTLIALTVLADLGWNVQAWVISTRPEKDELIHNFMTSGGEITLALNDMKREKLGIMLGKSEILLDGLLGTGIRLPLNTEISGLLRFINGKIDEKIIIAVDCPSGVDCDSGQTSPETMSADFTFCLGAVKTGLLKMPAFTKAGMVVDIPIGLPAGLPSWKSIHREVMSEEMISLMLPERPLDAHKGTFGTALILAGSINFPGAALLAGKATYRVGAGLVKMVVAGLLQPILAGHIPEATWILLPHEMGAINGDGAEILFRNLEKANVLLMGPGWGQENTTQEFLKKVLLKRGANYVKKSIGFLDGLEKKECKATSLPPLVIDADGLNLLSKIQDWQKILPPQTILTPHPGEMALLTGSKVEEIQTNRMEAAEYFSKLWSQVVVLKGACTVVAAPDGRLRVCPVATPALARAGSGDVLAGMIAGLRAQGMDAYNSATAGVWLHSQIGLIAEERFGSSAGIMACDLIDIIPEALFDLEEKKRR